MTLPVSPNSIAMSQVNVEIGRPATQLLSLNDADVRTLANKPGSGTLISMNDLRGKTWLNAQIVTTWVSANRHLLFKSQAHSNTSDYEQANINIQNTSYTATFNLANATLQNSKWTTIVALTVNGLGDEIRNARVTNMTFTTTDGSSPSAEPRVQIINEYGMGGAVLRVNTNFKKIASVTVTWSDGYTYRVSTACIAVIPGKWNGQVELGPTDSYQWYPGSFAYNIQVGVANTATVGTLPDYPLGNITRPTGTTGIARDVWWYNTVQFNMLINPTADNKTFTVPGGGSGFYDDQYAGTVTYLITARPRGYRLHTFVEP